ncbi:MAG: CAP domain-containing protein [Robiginitalea sp.]|jgi:uncharacterized protein YkwD
MKLKLQHASLALLMIFGLSCTKDSVDSEPVPVARIDSALETELLQLVNEHRVLLGYTPLSFSQLAYSYASEHTDYMIAKGSLNHDNFSARASGIASEVNAKAVSENVAKDYDSAEKALQGWLASESHRKTMEGEFSHTAISVKENTEGTLYYTQLFYLE